jgi:hypothetical protein
VFFFEKLFTTIGGASGELFYQMWTCLFISCEYTQRAVLILMATKSALKNIRKTGKNRPAGAARTRKDEKVNNPNFTAGWRG